MKKHRKICNVKKNVYSFVGLPFLLTTLKMCLV